MADDDVRRATVRAREEAYSEQNRLESMLTKTRREIDQLDHSLDHPGEPPSLAGVPDSPRAGGSQNSRARNVAGRGGVIWVVVRCYSSVQSGF